MLKRLSVLELGLIDPLSNGTDSIKNGITLAQKADELGYNRFWIAEHHNMEIISATSPEILIGQVLARTKSLRVGSGGVMLPNQSPLKVAETFKTLEALYPGRIDLGIGRAPGADALTALALRRAMHPHNADDLSELLTELFDYETEKTASENNPFGSIVAMPQSAPLPPVFLLGSSSYSAELAAREGLEYSFGYYLNPANAEDAISKYKSEYKRIHGTEAPSVILGLSVVSGETTEEVERQKKLISIKYLKGTGHLKGVDTSVAENVLLPHHEQMMANSYLMTQVIGTYEELKCKLEQFAKRFGTEELLITTNQVGFDSRIQLYENLASLFNLKEEAAKFD